ncbi:MAG: hypothetical protein KDC38_09675 [Planctomycetes bacterium]|nr:hypothetical protein [Planctomycetota bacterium]
MIDPRDLDRLLDEAADSERRAPTPDPEAFLVRLRRRRGGPLGPHAGWIVASLAAAALIVAVIFLAQSKSSPSAQDSGIARGDDSAMSVDNEIDVLVLDHLEEFELLAQVVDDGDGAAELIEICTDLELLQDDEIGNLLSEFVGENG